MISCFECNYKINEIINTFLLAGGKFIPEMYLNNLSLPALLVDHLLKTKKISKNSKKQEIQDILTEIN